jgi:hypothetical protein
VKSYPVKYSEGLGKATESEKRGVYIGSITVGGREVESMKSETESLKSGLMRLER